MGKAFDVNEIREMLSDEIRAVRDGTTTAANVNAIVNATGKILSSIKLQLDYCKTIGKTPDLELLLPDAFAKGEPNKVKAIGSK